MLWTLRLTLRRVLIAGVLVLTVTLFIAQSAPQMPSSGWLITYATTESSAAFWQLHLMDVERRLSFPVNDAIYTGQPVISPDGRYAIIADRSGLRLEDLHSGRGSAIEPGHHALWHPDGDQFAYGGSVRGEQETTLYIRQMGQDGTHSALTSVEMGMNFIPVSWSPDGRYIAAYNEDELLVVDPEQSSIAHRLDVATGTQVITWIDWSADSTALAFGLTDIQTFNRASINVALLGSDEIITLLDGLENVERLAWSPNRLGPSRLAVIYRQGNTTPLRLLTLTPDYRAYTSDLPVPINSRQIQWSPDGRRLLFISRREADIYVVDAVGSNLRRLTDNDKYNVLLR